MFNGTQIHIMFVSKVLHHVAFNESYLNARKKYVPKYKKKGRNIKINPSVKDLLTILFHGGKLKP